MLLLVDVGDLVTVPVIAAAVVVAVAEEVDDAGF